MTESTNTILSDQLSSLSEGEVVKIWLVLAQSASLAPPGLLAVILLEAAKFALDSMMTRDWAIWPNSNGWLIILWSLTYDKRSAWSYYLSAGFV